MDCIFCKIAKHEVPTEVVYEDEKIIALNDSNPQAPIHLLIVPKKHISSIMDITEEDGKILGEIALVAQELARKNSIDNKGFRLVINTGKEGGQTVNHLHIHLLGGRSLTWPPG